MNEAPTPEDAASCANCGVQLSGAYCARCGQSAHEGRPPTIQYFFHDLTHEILHVDGKIFRSLSALLFRPGLLTQEYWAGRVVRWVRPIRLFLIAAALHLVFAPGIGPLNLRFEAYRRVDTGRLSFSVYWGPGRAPDANFRPLVGQEREFVFARFERSYLAVRYLSPLLFAFVSWRVYGRNEPYFLRHLIGGLHFYSVWYLLAIVTGWLGRCISMCQPTDSARAGHPVSAFFTAKPLPCRQNEGRMNRLRLARGDAAETILPSGRQGYFHRPRHGWKPNRRGSLPMWWTEFVRVRTHS